MKYILFIALLFASPLYAATYLVENVARIKGQEMTVITGWGIVSGLPGTGDNPKSYTPAAEAKLKELEHAGMPVTPGENRLEIELHSVLCLIQYLFHHSSLLSVDLHPFPSNRDLYPCVR